MRKIALLILLPVLLSACADNSQYLYTEELRGLKPGCAGGDTSVCSDIGHQVRRESGESSQLTEPAG